MKVDLAEPSHRPSQVQNIPPSPATEKRIYNLASMSAEEARAFVMNPVPPGEILEITVVRSKGGFLNLYPKYSMHFTDGMGFILAGKKRGANKSSNYLMSLSQTDINKDSPQIVGKVRSNFVGTEFTIYDNGVNPDREKGTAFTKWRKELGVVFYESNFMKGKTPRKMNCYLPNVSESGEQAEFRPMDVNQGMAALVRQQREENMMHMINKSPVWNAELGAFTLNFRGRVKKPSVKNFQLIFQHDDKNVLLQFGRVTDETFNLDVSWPFSLVQAFGLCLSSFDYKLACE
jgi:tubby-related protein 1